MKKSSHHAFHIFASAFDDTVLRARSDTDSRRARHAPHLMRLGLQKGRSQQREGKPFVSHDHGLSCAIIHLPFGVDIVVYW